MISMLGGAKRSAFSFKSHPGVLSGPCALAGLIHHNFLRMDNCDTGEKSSLAVLFKDTETLPPPPPKWIVSERFEILHWG